MVFRRRDLVSLILLACLLGLVGVSLWWLSTTPGAGKGQDDSSEGIHPGGWNHQPLAGVIRLGIIPERDVFAQRKRYQSLANFLSEMVERPVEVVTLNTYQGVLEDLKEGQIDGAFLGSLMTVLAYDRLGVRILAKPIEPDGSATYRGVIFVPADSPVTDVSGLRGRSLAVVRGTMAGHLFPLGLLMRQGLLDGDEPVTLRWVGTHDDVAREVLTGRIDAGAIKNHRLSVYLAEHPQARVRELSVSDEVPNNALVMRAGADPEVVERLRRVLLTMEHTLPGRAALRQFGALRFERCGIEEYRAIYQMVHQLGGRWEQTGIAGDPPRWRPTP